MSETQIDAEVLKTIFNHSNDAICIVNLEQDSIVECNPAAEELFGYSRQELLSLSASDLHPQNFDAFLTFADSVVEEGSGWTDELTCYKKDGKQIPSEISATVHEINGETCLISIIRDISDRHQRERALQRENERLELLTQMISHDLRNPLNVVLGHLEMEQQKNDSDHLTSMKSALDRAFDILDETLVFAKQGGEIEQVESIRLDAIIKNCWENVKTKDAELSIESDCEIVADPDRLKHLLENLIRNAVEHTNGDVTISVGSIQDGFYIADSGSGIPESDGEQIFDMGYTTADDGTGYGLTIVEEIVEAHEWSLEVSEADNGGARFEITDVEEQNY
jgi:PAS domain S-box-containing protein